MEPEFTKLGKPANRPSKELDVFPKPENVTSVQFTSEELTSHCPITGQPDFSRVVIEYRPDRSCVESKSLKLYLWTFRDEKIFGEGLADTIARDLFHRLQPHSCKVTVVQNVRGGLQMTAVAEIHRAE